MQSNTSTALLPLPENPDTLIRRSQVPQYLPVSVQTLARWKCEGRGPRHRKIGRRLVAYTARDLKEWIENGDQATRGSVTSTH